MSSIHLATVLPGAVGFKEGNVNETYRGQILLEDGSVRGAILKDLDARQMANELLAFVLARATGLPTPDVYIALVRDGDLPTAKAPTLDDGGRIVFASADVMAPNVALRVKQAAAAERMQLIADIIDWTDLGNLYAFDGWLANVDRHAGNLLFAGKDRLWLIDHGHCFSGPNWVPEDLNPARYYKNRLSEWMSGRLTLDQKQKRSKEAQALAARAGAIDVNGYTDESRIDMLLPADCVSALKTFLAGRLKYLASHVNAALGIPELL